MKLRAVALFAAVWASSGLARGASEVVRDTRRVVIVHRHWLPASPELRDALIMLAHVGERGDRLAIVELGGTATLRLPSVSLGRTDLDHPIAQALEAPPATEPGNHLGPAVRAALAALGPRSASAVDSLWILPSPEEPPTARIDEIVPEAQVRQVEIHVLGLGSPIHPLYREIARGTGGHVRRVDPASPPHRVALDLVAQSSASDSLPVRGGAFWVDPRAESIVVLADREPDERITLIGSDETVHTLEKPVGLEWHRYDRHDLVEIDGPLPGLWRLDQSHGLDRARVVVRRSPLRLVLDVDPRPATVGSPAKIRIRFEEYGRPLVSYARLKQMQVAAVIEPADGPPTELDLAREAGGWFRAFHAPSEVGSHGLRVQAESPELVRTHRFTFEAERQCFDLTTQWSHDAVAVDAELRDACLELARVQLRARFDGVDERGDPVPGHWKALAPGGAGVFSASLEREGPGELRIEAQALDGHRPRRFTFAPVSPPSSAESSSWGEVAVRLVVANLPLLLLSVLWVHRRQLHNLEVARHG